MGVFEYIGVLVSVIMGLGITHLATGTSKLIQHRSEVRLYLPHMLEHWPNSCTYRADSLYK